MKNPYELVNSTEIYCNPWIRVSEDKVIRPSGDCGIFGVVKMKDGATVLAIDKQLNVVLVEEYKYAVGRASIELISGGIDKNETPLDAAKRELKEEVGVESDDWINLGAIDPFTSVVASVNHIFLAKSVKYPVSFSSSLDEPLVRHIVPFTEALNMVINGRITHGASCVAILKAAAYL